MLWNRSRPIVGMAAIAGVFVACATNIPAGASLPEQERIVDVEFDGEHITMRDALTGDPIMVPRIMPLHGGREGFALSPTFEFTAHPEGFDLVASYHNDTPNPAHLGDIVLHTFTLGSRITIPDFRTTGEPVRANFANPPAWARNYPGDLYSPVSVIANEDYAIGVSLMYPVMEYRHDVIIAPRTRAGRAAEGEGGQGWQIRFSFSDPRDNLRTLHVPELIEPGKTQSYSFAVRVTRNPSDWIRTLQPYHDYFRSTYGEVKYERRTEPVRGATVAIGIRQTRSNPKGWSRPRDRRPDQFGWGPWADAIVGDRDFDRTMLWAPSGLYDEEHNYPLQFVSPLLDDPMLASAFDPRIGLPRVKAAGKELGLWWGHSARFAREWNPRELGVLDTSDPEHLEYVYRELDAARRAGATMIGLDEFTHRYINAWDAVEWLQTLQQRYPEFTFIVEPKATDIVHNVSPTYYRGFVWPQEASSYDDLTMIHTPHYLADLVNPGHETWAALRWDRFEHYFGHVASHERILSDVNKAARLGFVPLVHADVRSARLPHAAESWRWSIPSDMRDGDSYDGENVGRLPDGSGGGDGGSGGNADVPEFVPRLVLTRVRGENEPKRFAPPRYVTAIDTPGNEESRSNTRRRRIRDARPRIVTSYYNRYDDDSDDDDSSDDGSDENNGGGTEVFEGGDGGEEDAEIE